MNYKDLIYRLGYFRNLRNLSAREVSLRLGHTESWYYRVEAGQIELGCKALFEILEVLEINPAELFYYDLNKIEEDREINKAIQVLSIKEKEAVCNLINRK